MRVKQSRPSAPPAGVSPSAGVPAPAPAVTARATSARAASTLRSLARAAAAALLAVGAGAGVVGAVAGCGYEPPPFNPRQLQQMERELAGQNPTPAQRPLPRGMSSQFMNPDGSRREPPVGPAPDFAAGSPAQLSAARRFSLQDLVHLAAVNSLTVRVASYQPAIDSNRVIEAQGQFDPTFFVTPLYTHSDAIQPDPNQPLINRSVPNPTRESTLTSTQAPTGQLGIRQRLPYGGEATLSYNTSFTDAWVKGQQPPKINPFFENELLLQITQPLLQNFGRDINRARIVIAANTEKGSLLDFRLALEKNLAELEEAYWTLAQAEREIRIQETLLARTWDTANTLYQRWGQGVSNVEVSQANAELESRYIQLATLRATVVKASNKIKRLVNDPDLPVASPVLILPKDEPVDEPVVFDLDQQILIGLENRAELAQQQLKVDSSNVTLRAARNNELPNLNLVLRGGILGLGSNVGDVIRDQLKARNFDWAIGLEFTYPLGNREAKAITQRTLLQQLQAVTQYKDLVEQVTQEVKDAHADLSASWEELLAARRTRYARGVALSAFENQYRDVPEITPPLVQTRLQLQSDLANAERAEAEAASRYNIAISALERAKGTILRYDNVVMQEEMLPYSARGRQAR